jgi:hypothetical protein
MATLRDGPSGPLSPASAMPPGIVQVANLTLLGLLAPSNRITDGALAYVQSLKRCFQLDRYSADAPIAGQRVAATGGGSWRSTNAFSSKAGPWTSRTDWHIDAVTGSVEGDGSASSPLSSWVELKTRLDNQQLLPGTTISIHSDLAEIIDASQFIPDQTGLVITGDPGATTVLSATVLSYTGESFVAPGEAPILRSAAVADWTPYEGYRVRFTSGAASGAYTSIAVANPAGAGLDRARIPAPSLCAYPTASYPAPGVGSSFVLERLSAILGYSPPKVVIGIPTILRGFALPETLPPYGILIDGTIAMFGCTSGDIDIRGARADIQGCRFSSPAGLGAQIDSQGAYINSSTIHWSNCLSRYAFTNHNVWQEGLYIAGGSWTLHHSGCFDNAFGDGLTINSPGAFGFLSGRLYGSGNSDYGINVPFSGSCVAFDTLPVITGAINDAAVAGTASTWAALPPGGLIVNLAGIVKP